MNELTYITLSVVMGVGVVLWAYRDFKESHENFYFSVSNRISHLMLDVKNSVTSKDTQNLIEILFDSLEEHILYIMQHHKFLRKKHLNDNDVSRYNNLFYIYLSGISMEWFVNGIDTRLSSLFMDKNRKNIMKHMQQMRLVMLDKRTLPKNRRRKIVGLYLKMLNDIKDDYIKAYDDYVDVIDGNVKFEDLIKRSVFTQQEFIQIYNGIQNAVNEESQEEETTKHNLSHYSQTTENGATVLHGNLTPLKNKESD